MPALTTTSHTLMTYDPCQVKERLVHGVSPFRMGAQKCTTNGEVRGSGKWELGRHSPNRNTPCCSDLQSGSRMPLGSWHSGRRSGQRWGLLSNRKRCLWVARRRSRSAMVMRTTNADIRQSHWKSAKFCFMKSLVKTSCRAWL